MPSALLGALAGGSIAEWLGLRPTLLVGAAGVLVAALALAASAARQGARSPETPAPAGAPSDLSG